MTKQSNILTADLIATLYSTLTALFTIDMVRPILRHLLIKHLDRHVNFIAQRYRQHHLGKIEMAIKNTSSPKYQLFLFVRFMCALLQNNLVEPSDIDHLVYQRLGALFITQPSDVFFEITSGVEVKIKASTAPVCNSSDAFYFCRLWIEETRFRMAILLDLSYAALQHRYRYGHGHSLGFPLIIGMIREASSAFRLSKQSISVNE
ncbi:hypothetical protein BDF14DRAFT_1736905 [Spinellus fusiger]|nr:hypothetical protein BDF14DRAFT_1736905 [Spinellus fusiger]